jgi:hypothetical protein
LVDKRVEGNYAPGNVASNGFSVWQFGPCTRNHLGELVRDLCRQVSERDGQLSWRTAKIGSGENNACAHDANTDLAGARNGQHEHIRVRPPDGAERIGGDDGRSVARERR